MVLGQTEFQNRKGFCKDENLILIRRNNEPLTAQIDN